MKFRAGTKIPEFLHELKSTIRDYYGLTNVEQIDQIGMNHILSTLEDSVREDAKILQLSGNVKIENLLELIMTKLSKGFSPVQPIVAAAHSVHNNDRLSKLEKFVEKLTNQVSQLASNKNDSNNVKICSNCKKAGHVVSKCFKLKTCFICQKKGHIAKFCKENKNHTENPQQAAGSCDSVNLPSSRRIMIDIEISGTLVPFLYDPGSQYSMITRNVYDSLSTNQPPSPPPP